MAIYFQRRNQFACVMANRFTLYERERLEKTSTFILDNLQLALRLQDLCAMALMNRHRLNEGFKKIHGKKVFDFIREQRMQKAKELLLQTDESLEAIADATGYAYTNNFLRAYKQYFGNTPANERKEP